MGATYTSLCGETAENGTGLVKGNILYTYTLRLP
jgi:hypothetical protein